MGGKSLVGKSGSLKINKEQRIPDEIENMFLAEKKSRDNTLFTLKMLGLENDSSVPRILEDLSDSTECYQRTIKLKRNET